MNKQTALCLCWEILKSEGLHAMPKYNKYHNDYEITLNSTVHNRDINKFCGRYELKFKDFSFGRYEGHKTQDFPVFFREY